MIRRVVLPLLVGLAVYFALFGGQYSIFEVQRFRGSTVEEAAQLERLRAETDSLRARVDSLETDPATLERLARERFGMIGEGEVLYRFTGGEDAPEEEGDRAPR
jgi:cell division protein FtsB